MSRKRRYWVSNTEIKLYLQTEDMKNGVSEQNKQNSRRTRANFIGFVKRFE